MFVNVSQYSYAESGAQMMYGKRENDSKSRRQSNQTLPEKRAEQNEIEAIHERYQVDAVSR